MLDASFNMVEKKERKTRKKKQQGSDKRGQAASDSRVKTEAVFDSR